MEAPRTIRPGDRIETRGLSGRVTEVSLLDLDAGLDVLLRIDDLVQDALVHGSILADVPK